MDESADSDAANSVALENEPPLEIIEDLTRDAADKVDLGAGVGAEDDGKQSVVVKARSYQIEMLEQSLTRNVIVAMDTGSGKTHVAVMRMMVELERMPKDKFIWFLAPTVSLCAQQYEYIKSQITSVNVKMLSGEDDVDRWSQQKHWQTVLKNCSIVVSTYQILFDALSHGFVRIESLALIVIDEAHNCIGKHPGAKIFSNFYHPTKAKGQHVPHIMGLTASPVMRSKISSLTNIEETLDAICRTPKARLSELRQQVKLPVLSNVLFDSNVPGNLQSTKTVTSLEKAYLSLNLVEDPYVLQLAREGSQRSLAKLARVKLNLKTWSQDQMKTTFNTSVKICKELGPHAADFYVSQVSSRCRATIDTHTVIYDMATAEKEYVAKAFEQVEIPNANDSNIAISDKVSKLIQILLEDMSNFSGIIFVQERAMVFVLKYVLSIHVATRDCFRIGTMVGTSGRRSQNIGDLVDVAIQKDTLAKFRTGEINLLIATSVLEEGIDVPACNLVVCFTRPANLKSFVQRRGRARQRDSKLVILVDTLHDQMRREWEELEAQMKSIYEDDMRVLQKALLLEDGDDCNLDNRQFRVENTGAILDLDNAVAHLYHFCSVLPRQQYADTRPDFILMPNQAGLILAKVVLPLSITEEVRMTVGRRAWLSEKNAVRDAAFEAYVALFNAGLVNDNLLPLLKHDELIDELDSAPIESRPSLVCVREQLNPWVGIAKAWKDSAVSRSIYTSTVALGDLRIELCLPFELPGMAPATVYWDTNTELQILMSSACRANTNPEATVSRAMEETRALLSAAFSFRMEHKQIAAPFLTGLEVSRDGTGPTPLSDTDSSDSSVIRCSGIENVLFTFQEHLARKPPLDQVQHPSRNYDNLADGPYVALRRFSKRTDFLHRVHGSQDHDPSKKNYAYVSPLSACTMLAIPYHYIRFARLIPAIMNNIEVGLLGSTLSSTILADVGVKDQSLIITAISASSAQRSTNYQRLEFLGDSILKLCTSIQIAAENPLWHEGYLSAKKDRLVSNARLCRASIKAGLDKFVITKRFTGAKWRPMYVEDLLDEPSDRKRQISSKVLADVVEALVGASMIDGGIPRALACLQIFLPELEWQPLEMRRSSLYQRAPVKPLPVALELLESLVGYHFTKKSLLVEAMNHASYNSGSQSLERLEFLGDSILDHIVVQAMYSQPKELSHRQMHLLRTALVNADFLAFVCMNWSIEQDLHDLVTIEQPGDGGSCIEEKATKVEVPLWKFLRHASPPMALEQSAMADRFALLRDDIKAAVHSGTHYPWVLLARLQAQKFYSDMIESLLGAIWIDSGCFEICTRVVERMGILPYMRRILEDDVHLWHPKEELGQLADSATVKYELSDAFNEKDERVFTCRILVGERQVACVVGGVSKMEAQTKCAEQAVAILTRERGGLAGHKKPNVKAQGDNLELN